MDKKKIGILTFHRFINYGGLLQAYALCKTLNELNTDTSVIDYRSELLENVGNSKIFCNHISWKRRVKKLVYRKATTIKEKSFEEFINNYLPLSRSYKNENELCNIEKDYDLFITGSDQVWNSRWPYEGAYFLDFISDDLKKTSYGASLGDRGIPEDKRQDYIEKLKSYKAIAVREKSDKKLLEELLEREVVLTLDPVFLLDKSQWEELLSDNNTIKEKYCLIYTVNEPEKLIKEAKKYAKENNLKLIYLNPSFMQQFRTRNGEKIKTATPQEFVMYLYHADAVFTNSFHGTAFAYLFDKRFYVETTSNGRRNKRAADFLDMMGIESNQLQIDDQISRIQDNQNFNKLRNASINYLKSII